MTGLLGFLFDNTWGKAAAAVGGFLVLVGAFAWDQRNIGGERALNKLNRIESKANEIADRAASKSGARGVQPGAGRRRVLDPSTRDD